MTIKTLDKRGYCEHADFNNRVDCFTKAPGVTCWTCQKPHLCKGCAWRKGQEYKDFIDNALEDGDILRAGILNDVQLVAYQRKWSARCYQSWPIAEDTNFIISNAPIPNSTIITQSWVDTFDWQDLARVKWQWVEDSGEAHNKSGKLGFRAKVDDGKEAFRDQAVKFEKEVEQVGKQKMVEVGKELFNEVGPAQSVSEAEQHIKKFMDMLETALDKAGVKPEQYTILHCYSRVIFPIKTTQQAYAESNILEDDTLEILARIKEKQALAD